MVPQSAMPIAPRPDCSASARQSRGRPDIAFDHRMEEAAQLGRAAAAEARLEAFLRLEPVFARFVEALLARLGQVQLLAAPVEGARLHADKPVALQRQDVPPQRGAVDDEFGRQLVDRQRPFAREYRQDAELRDAQPRRREVAVIELRDRARGLAHGPAVAVEGGETVLLRHGRFRKRYLHMLLYCAHM